MEAVTGLDGCAVPTVHPDKVTAVREAAPADSELSEVTSVFKLLGDPTRTRLLYALLEAGELCVCDLAAATGLQEVTVSQSLRMLRASKVVIGRREGRNVYYRLLDAHVRLLLDITREHVLHAPGEGKS
ncbi:metalloregulator ArsR/SmtB family transcription factor [Epidermidibacterium keratini]|uniref:Metalloregulator ArsR/SmtB family transcription factor n=1 Tax=Epidermidibacterium keratini TaxID=1891644 RepID=A0A7L4YPB9_9ACTN|nr:metalloregulator ArsR/SmtB family transcription factor [Epidermidibacterium keratini]QHC00960.1 metalloregulator ArsR/SmtB family transcription factor [Epidermidibacterium keratini]